MNKLKLISKMASVHRFAGVQIIGKRFNIAEHSAEVCLYTSHIVRALLKSDYITKEQAFEINEYALIHDIPEVITGDIPFPLKSKYPEMKTLLDTIEEDAVVTLIPEYPSDQSAFTKFIVKLADLLAVTREMEYEVQAGNEEITIEYAGENCLKILDTAINKISQVNLQNPYVLIFSLKTFAAMIMDKKDSPLFGQIYQYIYEFLIECDPDYAEQVYRKSPQRVEALNKAKIS